ncbi:MAG: HEPN/Toprim-associated domain-containing protein, partial [Pyrinomonadaceae bacterium]
MGSMITLGIDKFEIDWGKNEFFRNHSQLFSESDKKDIPYYYADNIVNNQPGFSRKLKDVKRRLELLGYTLSGIRKMYEEIMEEVPGYYDESPPDFDLFATVITNVDVKQATLDEDWDGHDFGEYVVNHVFASPSFHKNAKELKSITKEGGMFFENLDPYIVLRLLMENPSNLELDLRWAFFDVVEGGYVDEDAIYEGVDEKNQYLIVTEGSSDLFIIKQALELYAPDIVDFFYFVDMDENYPFTGTGNLYRFCQGLSSIKIQNKILVIFDNDTAGKENYDKSIDLSLPSNMKITQLPYMQEFDNFLCIGPNGQSRENINGRAIAIENFLDLNYRMPREPSSRWLSYNKKLSAYHGALENKDKYVRLFNKARRDFT